MIWSRCHVCFFFVGKQLNCFHQAEIIGRCINIFFSSRMQPVAKFHFDSPSTRGERTKNASEGCPSGILLQILPNIAMLTSRVILPVAMPTGSGLDLREYGEEPYLR